MMALRRAAWKGLFASRALRLVLLVGWVLSLVWFLPKVLVRVLPVARATDLPRHVELVLMYGVGMAVCMMAVLVTLAVAGQFDRRRSRPSSPEPS